MFRAAKDFCHRPTVEQCKEEINKSHSCDFCSKGWDSDSEVDIHRKTAHKVELLHILKDKNSYLCRVCVKTHYSKEELIRHIKSWHLLSSEDAVRVEREIYICDGCSIVFFNKDMLQLHTCIFHTNRDKVRTPIECPKCLKQYRLKNLWTHFHRHHLMAVACCKICLLKCTDRHDVLKHTESHSKYLFCNICQYESKIDNYFKDHIAAKHGRQSRSHANDVKHEPYFVPRKSDKRSRFTTDTAVKGLRLSSFYNLKMGICVLCREICIGERSMKYHIQNAHMGCEKQQIWLFCSCSQMFNTKVLLKHHILKSGKDHRDAGTINSKGEVIMYAEKPVVDSECSHIKVESVDNVKVDSVDTIKVESMDDINVESIDTIKVDSIDNIKVESIDTIKSDSIIDNIKHESIDSIKSEILD